MNSKLVLVGLVLLHFASSAQAQIGRAVQEAAEAVGSKVMGRAIRESAEEAAEQTVKRLTARAAREAAEETAEATAKRAGLAATQLTDDSLRAVAKQGAAVSAPLLKAFGDDGVKALAKLSPTNARRMAMVSEELAASGRGADWMRVLADKGDIAADWIWRNKASVGIAAVSTAFLANPDSFLRAGEAIATKGLDAAGKHVAQPLVEKAIGELAPRVGVAVVETSGRHPLLLLILTGIAGLCGWLGYRSWVSAFRPNLG